MGSVAQVDLATQYALWRRQRNPMYRNVFTRVVMSGGCVFTVLRPLFTSYATKVQDGVLREHGFAYHDHGGNYVARDSVLFRYLSGVNGNEDFLTSYRVGALCSLPFLVGGNVGYGHNLSNLAISSSRFPLSSSSQRRKVGNFSANLR